VSVASNLINPYSYIDEGIIDVIAGVPKSLLEWISFGYSKEEWSKTSRHYKGVQEIDQAKLNNIINKRILIKQIL
jgi:hypothetical protein